MHEERHRAEIRKDASLHIIFLFIILCTDADSLRVKVPAEPLVAARGHSVVLGCEFSPDFGQNTDLSSLVVTWQRQENNDVVHSFYYEQDQLEQQNSAYRDRTALFLSELRNGNASVKIDNVGVKDAGRYLCVVSTSQGTDRAELQLDYGAFYTEPRLTISVCPADILVQYETEGFPEPKVIWKGENGEILTNHVNTSMNPDQETGLYYVKSNYTAPNTPLNFTFILENQLLNQSLQRPFSYTAVQNSCLTESIALAVISCLLVLMTMILVWICYCKKK